MQLREVASRMADHADLDFVYIVSEKIEELENVKPKRKLFLRKYMFPNEKRGLSLLQILRFKIGAFVKRIFSFLYLDIQIINPDPDAFDSFDKYVKLRCESMNRLIDSNGIDLIIYTNWFDYPTLDRPFVQVVWDLAGCQYPYLPEFAENNRNDMEYGVIRSAARKAFRVITGNEVGKSDIVSMFSIPEERVICIPFVVPNLFEEQEEEHMDVPYPYLLFPSGTWPHKNHRVLVDAMAVLKEEKIDVHLVLTGPDRGNNETLLAHAKQLGISERVHHYGLVSNGQLKYLYKNAFALAYSSILGPNNFPPLEAMSLSCPALVSDIPGHRSQFGDAVIYFDPYNPEDLAGKVRGLLEDNGNRDVFIKRGRVYADSHQSDVYISGLLGVINEYRKYAKLAFKG